MSHPIFRSCFLVLLISAALPRALCQDAMPAPTEAVPETTPTAAPAPVAVPSPPPAATMTPAPEASATVSPTPAPTPKSAISIEIDLTKQKAFLLHDGKTIFESPISSGRAGHLTPTGNFEVLEKDPNHFSSLYGQMVEKKSGHVVISGADAAMSVPKGCFFKRAPMRFFMRFDGAAGMHAGILPGYPASHGCVRMPAAKAKLFYNTVELGSPVHVFGETPTHLVRVTPATRIAHTPRTANPPLPAPSPAPVHRGWWIFGH